LTGNITVDTANGLGMPCSGTQYARVVAHGPHASPNGGPAPEPAAGVTNRLLIPIPPGATFVSFCWDFYLAEGGGSGFNDGMSIDVVGATCGPSIQNLVYADDATSTNAGGSDTAVCGSFAGEAAPSGPQTTCVQLVAGGSYIRLIVWNGGDNAVASHGVLDNVAFPAVCPCQLQFTSPLGTGSIQMTNTPCVAVAGADYINAIALAQGLFPNGWFFGLDIPIGQLVAEFQTGFPFIGTLGGVGESTFGPITGAPSGLQIWAVSVQFAPGFGPFLFARPPVTYTIP
jgi:hypothetical protein